jgi:hypothetical protein
MGRDLTTLSRFQEGRSMLSKVLHNIDERFFCMNRRTTRLIVAAAAAIILVVIGIVVMNRSSSTGGSPQPAVASPQSAVASPQPASATVSQSGNYPVSTDQAGTIALASAPGATMTGAPMLVSYQGAIVYEVTLDTGMVYVDATSGKVLANTATNAATAAPNGGQGGEGGEGGEGGDNDD